MDFALNQFDLMQKIGREVEIARNKTNFAKVIDQINTMTTAIMKHYEIDSLDDQWKTEGHRNPSHWLNHVSYCPEYDREYDWQVLGAHFDPDTDEGYLYTLVWDCRDDEAIFNKRGEYRKIIVEAVFGERDGRYIGRV